MDYLSEFAGQDFEQMAHDLSELSQNKTEDELLEIIGQSLYGLGYEIASSSEVDIIKPISSSELRNMGIAAAVDFVENRNLALTEQVKMEAVGFWKGFKEKLKEAICNDPKIRDLITGDGTLKEYLIVGVPLVLAALGMSALNPLLLAIVAAVFALIIKVGFKTYCEIA